MQVDFKALGQKFDMDWKIQDAAKQPRVLLLVSKIGHCLNDLLYRKSSGLLHADVRAVVSNHRDFEELTKAHQIPFYHLPVNPENKLSQEQRLLDIVEEEKIDLVVLARYMQVLSPELCRKLRGKIINIHHSFLPSFKGARPYAQAHARGVKLIGATAHLSLMILMKVRLLSRIPCEFVTHSVLNNLPQWVVTSNVSSWRVQ